MLKTAKTTNNVLSPHRAMGSSPELPATAKFEDRNDSFGLPTQDPGVERAIDEGVAWLCRA